MVGVPRGTIILNGANFTNSSVVLLDGIPANSSFENSTTIELVLDLSLSFLPQTHTVQVSDPVNGESNELTYDVYSPKPEPLPFSGQPSIAINQEATDQATLADVNGDGRSDLITFETPLGSTAPRMIFRFGRQDGTWSPPVTSRVALTKGKPAQVLAGDLTGRGRIDLVLIYPNSYQALLNNGSADFTAAGSGPLLGSNFGSSRMHSAIGFGPFAMHCLRQGISQW